MSPTRAGATSASNAALGISLTAVVLWVLAMIFARDDSGPEFLWPLSGLVGIVGAIVGWRAGRPKLGGKALAAVIAGGLIFLMIAGYIVWALIAGEF